MSRTMRRALALIATLALSCCLFTGTAWAAGTSAKITMGGADVKPGQEVILPINLADNPGIAGVGLEVALPEGATLKSIEKGALLSSGTFSVDKNIITWWADNDVKTNGVLANVTFTAPTAPGSYKVAVGFLDGRAANISNQNFEVVPATCEAGTLKVVDPESLKVDLSTCSVILAQTSYTYTGAEIKPAVTVKSGSTTLTANTDYTVAYKDNKAIGTATVTVTGKGNYKGTKSVTFTIAEPPKVSVAKATVVLSQSEFEADGTEKKPGVTVTYEGKTLTVGTDYDVAYKDNVAAGTASVTITGKGDYVGTKTATFKIVEPAPVPVIVDINDCYVRLAKDTYTYDGNAKKPGVIVQNGDVTLKADVDYTVSYANNINVGPATVTVAGKGNYTGSQTLDFYIEESVIIEDGDEVWSVDNDGKLQRYYGEDTNVVVPSVINGITVTSIAGNAFSFDEGANASITLPDTVTEIDEDAFIFNPGITSVTLPSSLESIGPWAFYGCTGLTSIELPSSLTYIGERAFGQTGLTSVTVPGGVTEVPFSAFCECQGLKTVVLESGVQTIGDSAFEGCLSLESLNLPNSVTTIGESVFSDCVNLADFALPSGLESIGSYAFSSCARLTDVTIPAGLTSFGYNVFSGCENLKTVTFADGFSAVPESMFQDYPSLEKVVFPASLTEIGANAFSGCENLSEAALPENLTTIGDGAFRDCPSLTSVRIPKSLENVGSWVFDYDTNLTSVEFADGMTKIPAEMFQGCESITDVTLPASLTTIGDSAFYSCANLTSIVIPANVKTIEDWAFGDCVSMKNVEFKGHAPSAIGTCTFASVAATVKTPSGDSTWTAEIIESLGYDLQWPQGGVMPGVVDLSACDIYFNTLFYDYTGSAITPDLVVSYGGDDLAEGTDYTISCNNNVNVGTATVTVTGKGAYAGSQELEFYIDPLDISDADITVSDLAYNGKEQSPTVTVKHNGKQLVEGTDYTLSGSTKALHVGTHTLLITGKGNYTGSTESTYKMTGTETGNALVNIARLKPHFKNNKTAYTYNYGYSIRPEVEIPGLVEGEDYFVIYYSNSEVGTGYADVYGEGVFNSDSNYVGVVRLSFEIKPISLASIVKKVAKSTVTYNNGKAVKCGGVVFKGTAPELFDSEEVEGDYVLSYSNNKNIGTAYVTVKTNSYCSGNFSGSKKLSFKIVPPKATISKATAAKKAITVKVKAQKGGVKYQYSYRLGKGKWVNKTSTKSTLKITKLKSKKKYQVRVRTFKKVGKTTYYGAWSTAKTVKVK